MEHISKVIKQMGTPEEITQKLAREGLELMDSDKASIECSICNDAGFVHPLLDNGKPDYTQVIPCRCKRERSQQLRPERLFKNSGLSDRSKSFENFNTYNDKYYAEALAASREITQDFGDVIFLTLMAESDRGKSHLAKAAVLDCVQENKSAIYVNVAGMLNELRSGFDNRDNNFDTRLKRYCNTFLLAMDDFGTERITAWGAEQLQTILNSRYDNKMRTIITTNRPIDDLFNFQDFRNEDWRDLANMRFESRLKRESWCKVILIDSKSHKEMSNAKRK